MKRRRDVQGAKQMLHDYMIFFDGEWQIPPAFYRVAEVKGKSPDDAIEANLAEIIRDARNSYPEVVDGLDDDHIEEALFTVPSDFWMSRHKAAWQSMSSGKD